MRATPTCCSWDNFSHPQRELATKISCFQSVLLKEQLDYYNGSFHRLNEFFKLIGGIENFRVHIEFRTRDTGHKRKKNVCTQEKYIGFSVQTFFKMLALQIPTNFLQRHLPKKGMSHGLFREYISQEIPILNFWISDKFSTILKKFRQSFNRKIVTIPFFCPNLKK